MRFIRSVFQRSQKSAPESEAMLGAEPAPLAIAALPPTPEPEFVAVPEPEAEPESIHQAAPVIVAQPEEAILPVEAAVQLPPPVDQPAAAPQQAPELTKVCESAEGAAGSLPIPDEPSTAAVVQELDAARETALEVQEPEAEPPIASPTEELPAATPGQVEEIAAAAEALEANATPEQEAESATVAEIDPVPQFEGESAPEQSTVAEAEVEQEPEPEAAVKQEPEPELEPVLENASETEPGLEVEPEAEPEKIVQPDSVAGEVMETRAVPEPVRPEQESSEPQAIDMEIAEIEATMQQDGPINVETVEVNQREPVEEIREHSEPSAEAQGADTPVAPESVAQSTRGSETPAELLAPSAPGPEEHATTAPGPTPVNVPIKHTIKPDDDKNSPFSILVGQVYEGPMDLLLDLIRKQDIDIYDIPIAKITEQFLAYVERMRASDMDMAGEFIYTASLLIHIKSKMLLPRAPNGPDDQIEDPRRELVERLLEHERFKNAAQMLQQKQMLEAATWTNPGIREFKDDEGAEPELAADTVDLARVFNQILDRFKNRPIINVEEDSVTVGQMIQFLARRLNMEDKPIALRKMLAHTHSRRALVAMFLALLELVRLQAILLRQDRLFSEIFIKKHENFDSVMTEGFMAAHDDWQ